MQTKQTIRMAVRSVAVFGFFAWFTLAGDIVETPPSSLAAAVPVVVTMEGVVRKLPHDPGALVQGLYYDSGRFIESTGGYGRSSLRQIDAVTGRIIRQHHLGDRVFGEGCAPIPGGLIVQLTWRNRIAYVYDAATWQLVATVDYPREGWGLLYNGRQLLASDGSHRLYWLAPNTLEEVGRIEVRRADGQRQRGINEMAWVEGRILANIFPTNRIVQINPDSGLIEQEWDLSTIAAGECQENVEHVLNGMAYDAATGRLWITGKGWRHFYEIVLPGLKTK